MSPTIWEEHILGGDSVWKGVHTHPDGSKTSSPSRDSQEEIEQWHRLMQEEDRRAAIGLTETQQEIINTCNEVSALLVAKNKKYGNSALEPIRIVCKADTITQIDSRIDDKLNRIKESNSDEDEDVVLDLIGYFVLKLIAERRRKKDAK